MFYCREQASDVTLPMFSFLAFSAIATIPATARNLLPACSTAWIEDTYRKVKVRGQSQRSRSKVRGKKTKVRGKEKSRGSRTNSTDKAERVAMLIE